MSGIRDPKLLFSVESSPVAPLDHPRTARGHSIFEIEIFDLVAKQVPGTMDFHDPRYWFCHQNLKSEMSGIRDRTAL